MSGQSPAAWLMARYRSRARSIQTNPCNNYLIDWRYDLCDSCETHLHADYYMCLFNLPEEYMLSEEIRPSSKFSHP